MTADNGGSRVGGVTVRVIVSGRFLTDELRYPWVSIHRNDAIPPLIQMQFLQAEAAELSHMPESGKAVMCRSSGIILIILSPSLSSVVVRAATITGEPVNGTIMAGQRNARARERENIDRLGASGLFFLDINSGCMVFGGQKCQGNRHRVKTADPRKYTQFL